MCNFALMSDFSYENAVQKLLINVMNTLKSSTHQQSLSPVLCDFYDLIFA